MTSFTPVPKSNVDIPSSGRKMSSRNTLRNSFRSNSFNNDDAVPADEMFARADDDDPGNSSVRLSAALSAEREETRIRLSRELEGEEDPPEPLDDDEEGDEGAPVGGGSGGEAMPMSLMDLLEETDRKAGIEGPTYRFDEEGEVTEEEDEMVEEAKERGGGKEVACSLCKVKHKGEALVPCGHAYCRMCSREMWVQKGHCPVCSSFVLEILEIF